MKCAEIQAKEKKTPAFVGRRLQHHKFECVTQMNLDAADSLDAAGLLLFKDEDHYYFLSVSQQESRQQRIAVSKVSSSGEIVLGEHTVINTNKKVNLKVVSKGTHYDFYYSIGNNKWQILCQNVDARFLSTADCGGFTGTTIGMYAMRNAE